MNRIRVGTAQYFLRPLQDFSEFKIQVLGILETAKDYGCQLVVFPEYFTIQLLTLGDLKRPLGLQLRDLAFLKDRYTEFFSKEARRLGLHIVAGTTLGWAADSERLVNTSVVFGPSGNFVSQGKLHMTRFEAEEWMVSASQGLKIIETSFGKIAVNICYDVEFPELARAAAHAGATLLIVPSCTDDRKGWLRVRYCAQARAIENQMYVIQSSTVGSLPQVTAAHLNYGQSSILCPSDHGFGRDGIVAEGVTNQETLVVAEIDFDQLTHSRVQGTVLPLRDSANSKKIASDVEVLSLR
jgi:predicted amidohydrolase